MLQSSARTVGHEMGPTPHFAMRQGAYTVTARGRHSTRVRLLGNVGSGDAARMAVNTLGGCELLSFLPIPSAAQSFVELRVSG
jgi:hypothetical protein